MKPLLQAGLLGGWMLAAVFVAPVVWAFDPEAVQLDRLFTTPAERRELDKIRANYRPGDIHPDESGESRPQSVTVNGVVLRKSGRNSAWVNGRSTVSGSTADWDVNLQGATTEHGVSVPVSQSGTERSYDMQPGQTLQTGTGQLHEGWQQANPSPESVEP